jgi:hypothetical protein
MLSIPHVIFVLVIRRQDSLPTLCPKGNVAQLAGTRLFKIDHLQIIGTVRSANRTIGSDLGQQPSSRVNRRDSTDLIGLQRAAKGNLVQSMLDASERLPAGGQGRQLRRPLFCKLLVEGRAGLSSMETRVALWPGRHTWRKLVLIRPRTPSLRPIVKVPVSGSCWISLRD